MPTYKEPMLTISINVKTQFIIDQYHQALIESGIITQDNHAVTELHFDERLCIKKGVPGKGLIKTFARGAEKIFETPHGGHESTLDKFEADISDINLSDFYDIYIMGWSGCLSVLEQGMFFSSALSDEVIDRPKIQHAHVLTMRLMLRLVLFILSDDNRIKIDHKKYFDAIGLFVKKIIQAETLFGAVDALDSMRQYLQEEHPICIKSFKASIESLQEFASHQKAILDMRNLMDSINIVIKRQLLVYLNPESTKHALADINYKRNLQELEDKLIANNHAKILKTLDGESLSRHIALILILKNQKYNHLDPLATLYALLLKVEDIQTLIENIRKLIESTGWISLLSNCLKLSELGVFLEKFYQDAEQTLNIKKQLPEKARNILHIHDAANLDKLSDLPRTITENVRRIENKAFQEKIIGRITVSIQGIFQAQEKLGLQLISPDFAENFRIKSPQSMQPIESTDRSSLFEEETIAVPAAAAAAAAGLFKLKSSVQSDELAKVPTATEHSSKPASPDIYVAPTPVVPTPISKTTKPSLVNGEKLIQVDNGCCDVSNYSLSQLKPGNIYELFIKIQSLQNVTTISFKNNGFVRKNEQVKEAYTAFSQNLHLIPSSVSTLDLSANGFELLARKELRELFSKIPSSVQRIVLINGKLAQSRHVWLERVNWPRSYYNMTADACEKKNSIEIAKILLNDYTKAGSAFVRFFSAHWNRHHVSAVQAIVLQMKRFSVTENEQPLDIGILAKLREIETPNLRGSLARRVSFIQHMNSQSFQDMELLNSTEESEEESAVNVTII